MQLEVEQPVRVGDRLRLIFVLYGDPHEIDVEVLTLGVRQLDTPGSLYRAHARFIDIEHALQERIVRFVFREQLHIRS